MIYLDYAASSPPFPQAIDEMRTVSLEQFGNPGALHKLGADARGILQKSRLLLAQLTSVRPEEIFFTSGGTESCNWAVRAGCAADGRKHIVCNSAEHSSVLAAVAEMERIGYDVTYLNPDRSGRILPESVEAVLRPDTALLCVQAVNNETGVIQDVDALAALAHSKGARYFCDGVQSFGHVKQNLHKADLISLSAHKIGGPRGIGCLIVRYPHLVDPMIVGGGQEFGLRSGTENLPGISGFACAAALSAEALPREQPRLAALTALLEEELRKLCSEIRIAGEGAARSSILCCAFAGITGEEMVARLDLKGICASPGAACAARSSKPSHVLLCMGYTPKEAAEFVRFSLGRNTTEEEIRHTAAVVSDIVNRRS